MKTHKASKPYYVVTKDGKFVAASKIVLGRLVVTDGTVEWFDTEASFNAKVEAIKPKTK